ncbi:hypothetical protein GGS23DRAFT_602203 [Durotheca rogersii]|uniref:uncharacterized protein n=1 Tax=Durotheca rogersii TaxID=419775 RepID=UPI00221E6E67|nr:uncharacterized protein GGS23DRAFT_602203 [Durotheca rogersii]KAI5868416.1 hypothetical protein GGS23DRAFT_602203 [Durotheca rogersii]
MAHVARELDLNAYYGPSTIMDRMNVVPGLKTSTAFFLFLRANLVANPSAMSTPDMVPASSHALPPPSPSPLATVDPPNNPVPDDLPPLYVGVLSDEADKVDALNLVADSIAQQRQSSSYHLIFHPYLLAVLAAGLGAAYQYSWRVRRDLGTALMLHAGVVMIYLLSIRYVTAQYIRVAEDMRWSWLASEDGEPDTVIGVRFGRDLIGALVLRLEPPPHASPTGKKRGRAAALRGGKGVIRAWTVKLRYRGQRLGVDMLHEAIRTTRERCGRDAEVGFAREHANSAPVLPEAFNGPARRNEQRAAKTLERVLADWEGSRRRRKV